MTGVRRPCGRCREHDETDDVAVDLVGGQHRPEEVPEEQPARLHAERLHQPGHAHGDRDAAPVATHLSEGGEVDLQHTNGWTASTVPLFLARASGRPW